MKINQIRNFCIISHIDHGKSTLADAFLEITHNLDFKKHELVMDDLDIEQERGITIKMNTAQFKYRDYYLNLIDTPGHLDFNYEVKRAIFACEGALLLVDATKGIQAQTIANLRLAQAANLKIIPVINKIDLPGNQIENIKIALKQLLGNESAEIILISAKRREGIVKLLDEIILKIPSPEGKKDAPCQALVFDAQYDSYRGVILFIRVKNGFFNQKTKIKNLRSKQVYEILELGFKQPDRVPQTELSVGQVGYLQTNLKNLNEILIGDTITSTNNASTTSLLRFTKTQPDVFANVFPVENNRYNELSIAIAKIGLNDAAFQYQKISSGSLGSGFHCGFLGLLHLEIIQERLEKEHQMPVIITLPSVKYRFTFTNKTETIIENINLIENWQKVAKIAEPIVDIEIITPLRYLGEVMKVCLERRGIYQNEKLLNNDDVIINFVMPLKEIITDLLNELKSVTNGYASFAYQNERFMENDLVKLEIHLNGKVIHPFNQIVFRKNGAAIGRKLCKKLKNLLPRQNFEIRIQAAINQKIIARETISAYRKDVTAKCYGGDISRKRKLWEKQKAGKKKMRSFGKITVPHKVFIKIMEK